MLGGLVSVIEELGAEDLTSVDDAVLLSEVPALFSLLDRLSAQILRRVAEVDARGAYRVEGHLSTTGWVSQVTGLSTGAARRKVRTARRVADSPVMAEAFRSGRVTEERVAVLADLSETYPVLFGDSEEMLVEFAQDLSSPAFRKAIRYWRELADELSMSGGGNVEFQRRWLRVSQSFSGLVHIEGVLDPESGAVVMEALAAATTYADRAVAGEDGRREPVRARRADGLVEICRRWLDQGETVVGGERPHVSVVVDLARLQSGGGPGRSEIGDWGAVIGAKAARRLACDAGVSRIIVGPDSEPLDVGRRTRTIPPAIRRALVVRDGGCRFPWCDRPASWCDAHHIRHWVDGGPTCLSNLVLLCRRHHRLLHEGGYTIEYLNGRMEFRDSAGFFLPVDGRDRELREIMSKMATIRPVRPTGSPVPPRRAHEVKRSVVGYEIGFNRDNGP